MLIISLFFSQKIASVKLGQIDPYGRRYNISSALKFSNLLGYNLRKYLINRSILYHTYQNFLTIHRPNTVEHPVFYTKVDRNFFCLIQKLREHNCIHHQQHIPMLNCQNTIKKVCFFKLLMLMFDVNLHLILLHQSLHMLYFTSSFFLKLLVWTVKARRLAPSFGTAPSDFRQEASCPDHSAQGEKSIGK